MTRRTAGFDLEVKWLVGGEAPGLVAGEQPLLRTAANMLDFRASTKVLCQISNTPPALQSCETLPEGWPCLSTDSAQIGAVKVS
jgi:hypothetical protein